MAHLCRKARPERSSLAMDGRRISSPKTCERRLRAKVILSWIVEAGIGSSTLARTRHCPALNCLEGKEGSKGLVRGFAVPVIEPCAAMHRFQCAADGNKAVTVTGCINYITALPRAATLARPRHGSRDTHQRGCSGMQKLPGRSNHRTDSPSFHAAQRPPMRCRRSDNSGPQPERVAIVCRLEPRHSSTLSISIKVPQAALPVSLEGLGNSTLTLAEFRNRLTLASYRGDQ